MNLKNIMAYLQGNYRYKLWYSPFRWLIRKHIRQQIELRIRFMDNDCYTNGVCKLCGCTTTALQMSNKECDKPCYPEMMSKHKWEDFSIGDLWSNREPYIDKKGRVWSYASSDTLEILSYNNPYTKETRTYYPKLK